jgi:hypothetical protein
MTLSGRVYHLCTVHTLWGAIYGNDLPIIQHVMLRMDYTFSLQGALNEDSKGLSSAKE